jgi:hypothetical protein
VKTKYFETNYEGLNLVNQAIKELEIKVTPETTVEQLHLIHNAITAYVTDQLIKRTK